MDGTIVAVASPPGAAERGVLRLSGPASGALVRETFTPTTEPLARELERGAYRGRFHDGVGDQPAALLWMPGPRSYTGEDVAELHLPGAPALLGVALGHLVSLGARPAAAGEFTRRAFLNGRLELARAEGVLALTEAVGEGERRAAMELFVGGLDGRVQRLRDGFEDLRALCEASLDFDETDTGHVETELLLRMGEALAAGLAEALSWEVARQPPTELPRVVLSGAPNAGKSSLFNALARGSALVSPEAGTTRDVLTAAVELPGGAALLVDTAGHDPGAQGPDGGAQQRALHERQAAHLLVHVVDAAGSEPIRSAGSPEPDLVLWNQVDRPGSRPLPGEAGVMVLRTSAHTGEGLDRVRRALGDLLQERPGQGAARMLFARHREALLAAQRGLEEAQGGLREGAPLDLVAEALRAGTDALDGLTGRTQAEDLLDRIFSRFCIGK